MSLISTSVLVIWMAIWMSVLVLLQAKVEIRSHENSKRDITEEDFEAVGCYIDKGGDMRGFDKLFANLRGGPHFWRESGDYSYVVKLCAKKAMKIGYQYFGVQFYGECWGGKINGEWKYDRNGPAKSSRCVGHVGKGWTNMVYKLKGCSQGDDFYPIDTEMPKDKDDPCVTCKCFQTGERVCHTVQCPSVGGVLCEKQVTAEGECCPYCACKHNGQNMDDDSVWDRNVNEDLCSRCVCDKGEANCFKPMCEDCSYPVEVPGKCCPTCGPGPIIPQTTSRPLPTFPFLWP